MNLDLEVFEDIQKFIKKMENGDESIPEAINYRVEFMQMYRSTYSILMSLIVGEAEISALQNLEAIVKLDLMEFAYLAESMLGDYIESGNEDDIEKKLLDGISLNNFLASCDKDAEVLPFFIPAKAAKELDKKNIHIANKVISVIAKLSLNQKLLHYAKIKEGNSPFNVFVKNLNIGSEMELAIESSYWSIVTMFILSEANSDNSVFHAKHSEGMARGYLGASLLLKKRNSENGAKGAKLRNRKNELVKDYVKLRVDESMEKGQFKSAYNERSKLRSDVWEYSKKVEANLTETGFDNTLYRWINEYGKSVKVNK